MTRRSERTKANPGVLVTGASSGIGQEIAREFAAMGYDLMLTARNEQRLAELAAELRSEHNVDVIFMPCDLTEKDAAESIHKWVRKQGFSVDILVNNAGFDVYGPVSDNDMQAELDMLQVNVIALAALTKKFRPRMFKRGRGRILNVGSTGSFVPTPLNALYCASKAFVLSFSAGLAEECRGSGVSVTCICPGVTRTRFHERADMEDIPLMKLGVMDASSVARIAVRACMKGRRLLVVGTSNKLSMFFMSFLPLSWRARLAGKLISR